MNFEKVIIKNMKVYMKGDVIVSMSFDSRRFVDGTTHLYRPLRYVRRVFRGDGLLITRLTSVPKSRHIIAMNYWLRRGLGGYKTRT